MFLLFLEAVDGGRIPCPSGLEILEVPVRKTPGCLYPGSSPGEGDLGPGSVPLFDLVPSGLIESRQTPLAGNGLHLVAARSFGKLL